MAFVAGPGSFGLHRMLITDAGCAGRFGSVVTDAEIPFTPPPLKERCLYFHDGSCVECIMRCPVKALSMDGAIDKHLCNHRLAGLAKVFDPRGFEAEDVGDAWGKCAIGPCSLQSAVA